MPSAYARGLFTHGIQVRDSQGMLVGEVKATKEPSADLLHFVEFLSDDRIGRGKAMSYAEVSEAMGRGKSDNKVGNWHAWLHVNTDAVVRDGTQVRYRDGFEALARIGSKALIRAGSEVWAHEMPGVRADPEVAPEAAPEEVLEAIDEAATGAAPDAAPEAALKRLLKRLPMQFWT